VQLVEPEERGKSPYFSFAVRDWQEFQGCAGGFEGYCERIFWEIDLNLS